METANGTSTTHHSAHIQLRSEHDYAVSFKDIEIIRFVGEGTISMGFQARLNNQTVIAKFTGDRFLHYSDTEIDMFEILKLIIEAPSLSIGRHFSVLNTAPLKSMPI
jgi:hypothetical protein